MTPRQKLDISAYFVVGPENTRGRPAGDIIGDVIRAGFTCIQIRSKVASALELIDLTREAADRIARAGRTDQVTLLVDDRLDVVLAARKLGIRVDGVHVGQSDIPVSICREYLGDDAVIGLSARTDELLATVDSLDTGIVDYLGAGPLHETATKTDIPLGADGRMITQPLEEIARLAGRSPVPVVVGGGVKLPDIPSLAATGAGGFFVISAISEADNPGAVAEDFVKAWKSHTPRV